MNRYAGVTVHVSVDVATKNGCKTVWSVESAPGKYRHFTDQAAVSRYLDRRERAERQHREWLDSNLGRPDRPCRIVWDIVDGELKGSVVWRTPPSPYVGYDDKYVF